ncbi:polysaccharide pyruvyl transferase family protein [uncultured Draconibacterium sp.]|uniref:polysaccharide pyruvyl transferase family protein n=1 Tax=uncultured Draconibacterium sp. TaxID=1573823 RepID=UPI0032176CCB
MKIGIVTLPFNWNYGGILQTYALQHALKELGHEAVTINRNTVLMPFKMKVLSFVRRVILRVVFRKDVVLRTWPTKHEEKLIRQHTDRFIAEHVATTDLFRSEADFNTIDKYGFEAYVSGSDQVWRPKYSPSLKNHFLGFLANDSHAKRISYAASFGVDNWEFNEQDTKICSDLAQKYKAISVREDSAIDLCKKQLGVDAQLVLDPTMLVLKENYIALVEKDGIEKMPGSLFNYVLDLTPEKEQFINDAAKQLGLVAFSSTAKGSFRDLGKNKLNDCIFPPITQWLRSFMDAEFVITDSFHGTAFSIIFNKPFISIGNKKRGITRFSSLLKMLGLEDRLIFDFGADSLNKLNNTIDFEAVNKKLETQKKESFNFLRNALAD